MQNREMRLGVGEKPVGIWVTGAGIGRLATATGEGKM